jgi:hypothetical protein
VVNPKDSKTDSESASNSLQSKLELRSSMSLILVKNDSFDFLVVDKIQAH